MGVVDVGRLIFSPLDYSAVTYEHFLCQIYVKLQLLLSCEITTFSPLSIRKVLSFSVTSVRFPGVPEEGLSRPQF